MMRFKKRFLYIFLICVSSFSYAETTELSDADIRKLLISESIIQYPGSCPCPYNSARNGSRCGKRSAWSRPGGYSPLCYAKDVSDEMVNSYRKKINK